MKTEVKTTLLLDTEQFEKWADFMSWLKQDQAAKKEIADKQPYRICDTCETPNDWITKKCINCKTKFKC